ncbi:uncharacterized [Tachysurus ichikawai]
MTVLSEEDLAGDSVLLYRPQMIDKEQAGRSSEATQRLLCRCPTSYVFPALVPSHGTLSRNKTKNRKEAEAN